MDTSHDYADIIAAGRLLQPQAEQQLNQFAKDNSQSNIVTASVAYLLHDYHSPESVHTLINLTKNQDALVRMNAVESLENLSDDQKITVLIPLLNDPVRAVRIEAARILASVPANSFTSSQQQLFNNSLTEYKKSQQVVIDTSEAKLNLAELAEAQHDKNSAEKYYLKALQLNQNFYPATQNLAILYNSENKNDIAEKILREGIAHNPDQGELNYSLGLLLAQENKFDQSATILKTATQLMPNYPKVFYNYGLVLLHLNQYHDAEIALLKAVNLNPSDPNTLYALFDLYNQTQQWDKAQNYANELHEYFPDSPVTQQLNN